MRSPTTLRRPSAGSAPTWVVALRTSALRREDGLALPLAMIVILILSVLMLGLAETTTSELSLALPAHRDVGPRRPSLHRSVVGEQPRARGEGSAPALVHRERRRGAADGGQHARRADGAGQAGEGSIGPDRRGRPVAGRLGADGRLPPAGPEPVGVDRAVTLLTGPV